MWRAASSRIITVKGVVRSAGYRQLHIDVAPEVSCETLNNTNKY